MEFECKWGVYRKTYIFFLIHYFLHQVLDVCLKNEETNYWQPWDPKISNQPMKHNSMTYKCNYIFIKYKNYIRQKSPKPLPNMPCHIIHLLIIILKYIKIQFLSSLIKLNITNNSCTDTITFVSKMHCVLYTFNFCFINFVCWRFKKWTIVFFIIPKELIKLNHYFFNNFINNHFTNLNLSNLWEQD